MKLSELKWRAVDNVLVCYHTAGGFDESCLKEWQGILKSQQFAAYVASASPDFKPQAKERLGAAKALSEANIPVVTLTDDVFSRGIITTMRWFGANIDAFSWKNADAAVKTLKTSASTRGLVLDTIQQFYSEAEGRAHKQTG